LSTRPKAERPPAGLLACATCGIHRRRTGVAGGLLWSAITATTGHRHQAPQRPPASLLSASSGIGRRTQNDEKSETPSSSEGSPEYPPVGASVPMRGQPRRGRASLPEAVHPSDTVPRCGVVGSVHARILSSRPALCGRALDYAPAALSLAHPSRSSGGYSCDSLGVRSGASR
jgi:hypothetical protein